MRPHRLFFRNPMTPTGATKRNQYDSIDKPLENIWAVVLVDLKVAGVYSALGNKTHINLILLCPLEGGEVELHIHSL